MAKGTLKEWIAVDNPYISDVYKEAERRGKEGHCAYCNEKIGEFGTQMVLLGNPDPLCCGDKCSQDYFMLWIHLEGK